MKPLRVFSCVKVDVESHFPMQFSWHDIAEIHLALFKKKISFRNHLFAWFITKVLCIKLEEDLEKANIPPKYGVRSLCLLTSLAITAWNAIDTADDVKIPSDLFRFFFKREFTIKNDKWLTRFLESRGQFFDDTRKKATIVLSTIDKHDIAACSLIAQHFHTAVHKKQYDPMLISLIDSVCKILDADPSRFTVVLFENFDKALPAWEKIAAQYDGGSSLKYWGVVKQKVRAVIEKLRNPNERQYVADDVESFIDSANEAGAAFVASIIADKEHPTQPIDANIVSVAPSAGISLRAALKDPGGRPKKKSSGTKIATQGEMATSFGAPCTEDKIANWEAYERTNGQRGSRPFGFITKDGERIIYSAELRLNPTPDNQKRLTALMAEFQSRHRIKEAVGEKALHMKSAETLAKASGQVAAAIRDQGQLKYAK